jgi:S-adenosylmethionine:tRNA ribosyltransferase-isomerase
VRNADFDFNLPAELIAQVPSAERDQSRLLVLHRDSSLMDHRTFAGFLDYLRAGDVLVLNNSRVLPARLRGVNARTGGRFEVLLLEPKAVNDWWVMLRPGKRARVGTKICFRDRDGRATSLHATVLASNEEGHRRLGFEGTPNILDSIGSLGEMPLPPYIRRADASHAELDLQRYQTVYAEVAGSIAAPTAGLHFTESLLAAIRTRGVEVCFLTLHVGLGTFAPVKSEAISEHMMHEERYEMARNTAERIDRAKREGRRVIAVGTTTVRVLESIAARNEGRVRGGAGRTKIFIFPPYEFKVVDALVTNFHLPRSTLLMLVSAFAAPQRIQGRELILGAYAEAIRKHYRFFSYGDAMLIL